MPYNYQSVVESKHCKVCGHDKPLSEFYGTLLGVRAQSGTCSICCNLKQTLQRLLPPKPSSGLCPLLVPPMKQCTTCGTEKEASAENFRIRTQYGRLYSVTICRDCERTASREHYATVSPESRRSYSAYYEHSESGKAARARSVSKLVDTGWMKLHGRRKNLRLTYGLTVEEFEAMRESQGNRCAICGQIPTKILRIDHAHSERREVRGLLCEGCNSGLGVFHESPPRIFAAIHYLARPLPLVDRSQYPSRGSRDTGLRKLYGITLDAFEDLLRRQGGVCAICYGASGPQKKRLSVDHSHDISQSVRGLLCQPCNFGLGHFRDNPSALASAIWYLHKAEQRRAA